MEITLKWFANQTRTKKKSYEIFRNPDYYYKFLFETCNVCVAKKKSPKFEITCRIIINTYKRQILITIYSINLSLFIYKYIQSFFRNTEMQ